MQQMAASASAGKTKGDYMNYYAYVKNNTVLEVLTEYNDTFPNIPITKRYSDEFLSDCIECSSDVSAGDYYNGNNFIGKPPSGFRFDKITLSFVEIPIEELSALPKESSPDNIEAPLTLEERTTALEAENKTLKTQLAASAESTQFVEDCIAEMAAVVYA